MNKAISRKLARCEEIARSQLDNTLANLTVEMTAEDVTIFVGDYRKNRGLSARLRTRRIYHETLNS